MRRLPLILMLILMLAPALAFAGQHIYKWVDANGIAHFSDTPPPRGVKYEILDASDAPAASASSAAEPRGSIDTTALEENDDRDAMDSDPTAATNTKKMCDRLRGNMDLLRGSTPVTYNTEDGKPHLMSKDRRQQELQTAQQQYDNYCKMDGQ